MDHIRFDQPVIFDLIYSRIRIYANRIYAKTGYMQRLFWLPLLYFALFCIRLYAKTGYMQKFRWLPSVCIYADSTVTYTQGTGPRCMLYRSLTVSIKFTSIPQKL